MPDVFPFTEQQNIETKYKEFVSAGISFVETKYEHVPKYLGIFNGWTSYYIGAAWLTEDEDKSNADAVIVTPKKIGEKEEHETDFIELFLCALKFAPSAEYFAKFYGIDFNQPQIKTDAFSEQITPMLIVHYLWCLRQVVSRGLKKDYVVREENLKSKVRGRIMMQKNLQKNIFPQRMDRVYCKFQEYTVDIPENRLLKKGLVFSENYLNSLIRLNYHGSLGELKRQLSLVKSAFSQVSDDIEVHEIKTFRKNKLFKEYSEAIKIAKMILQRFDYSISKSNNQQQKVPPFWIDMSRLFEVYVYSKLYEVYGDNVKFQVQGSLRTVADFVKIDEKIILDAKYKTRYQKKNSALLEDIRELSGYARDNKILKTMEIEKGDEKVVECVIIYPEHVKIDIPDGNNLDNEERKEIEKNNNESQTEICFGEPILDLVKNHEIPGFRKFYKICVKLPVRDIMHSPNV